MRFRCCEHDEPSEPVVVDYCPTGEEFSKVVGIPLLLCEAFRYTRIIIFGARP
jgi:hypothetical protein